MPGFLDSAQATVGVETFFVFTSGNGYAGGNSVGLPAAGGDVDGVVMHNWTATDGTASTYPYAAVPGTTFRVQTGAAVTAGQLLQTDANGHAVGQTTGKAVARALQSAASSGIVIGAVFTSGR